MDIIKRTASPFRSTPTCCAILLVIIAGLFCADHCHGFTAPIQSSARANKVFLLTDQSHPAPFNVHARCTKLFSSAEDEMQSLRQKAAKLREEVSAFENSKQDERDKQERARQAVLREKEEYRMRYSAEVPILKADGSVEMERCDFAPRLKSEDGKLSRIIALQAPLPLGIVLGQSEEIPGLTTIDDIAEGGNGDLAGVKVGDLLRACTACQVSMDMPTWQLMAGGIGRPKTSRMMFSTDGKVFEEVMGAIASNNMDPEGRPTWLVVERVDE